MKRTIKSFDSILRSWGECRRVQVRSYIWRKLETKAERASPYTGCTLPCVCYSMQAWIVVLGRKDILEEIFALLCECTRPVLPSFLGSLILKRVSSEGWWILWCFSWPMENHTRAWRHLIFCVENLIITEGKADWAAQQNPVEILDSLQQSANTLFC